MNIEACEEGSLHSVRGFVALFALAAVVYTFRPGNWSLGASEAYSALAASQGSFAGVIQQALRFDPGKPPLYQLLLHCFVAQFGNSEASLRAFSVIFAVLALPPLYFLSFRMFGPNIGFTTVAIWALNPIAFVLGQWARMYSLFIATVVIDMLSFWRVREHATKGRIGVAGVCNALVLYTHLCGLLFVAVVALVLVRDFYRGRRALGPWQSLALAFALFLPFLPLETFQVRQLLLGHWLDWIGIAHLGWTLRKTVGVIATLAIMFVLVFGPQLENDEREPVRFCAIWLALPTLVLSDVSVIVRPVFALRYMAPAMPALALLTARGFEGLGTKVRNLSIAAVLMAFGVICFYCKADRYEPWQDIAREVATAGPEEVVFFESPLDLGVTQERTGEEPTVDKDFPAGYFKVPFDYYFKGPNPRRIIDPFDPIRSGEEIGAAASYAGGAWLVSGSENNGRLELPTTSRFLIRKVLQARDTCLYHVVALR
jgi:4-amino-4-deoxy-L-arabinose transferase-like glycosyltransferase